MFTGYKPSNSLGKSMSSAQTKPSLINESQLQSLQRQVDNYTRKLQQEKRRRFGIDQTLQMVLQHHQVTKEHQEHVERLKQLKIKAKDKQTVRLHAKIKNLQNQLDQAISVYDQTVAHNNSLKVEIDKLRKEKKNFVEIYKGLTIQQQKYNQVIDNKKKEIKDREIENEALENEIIELENKNEEEKKETIEKFDMLEKQYKQQKAERERNKMNEKKETIEMIDTQPVLRMRLKKLIAKNKEKVKIMDQYQRKMKLIQQAFNQIKMGSGISDIEEITNTFIKSQQQNYSLYNYVDILSQNIDNLTEQNKALEKKIKDQEKQNDERRKILSDTPEQQQKRKKLEQIIKSKQKVIEDLHSLIDSIAPQLEKTLKELANSKFNDQQNKIFDYEIGNQTQQVQTQTKIILSSILQIWKKKRTQLNTEPLVKDHSHKYKAPELTEEERKIFANESYNEMWNREKFTKQATQFINSKKKNIKPKD